MPAHCATERRPQNTIRLRRIFGIGDASPDADDAWAARGPLRSASPSLRDLPFEASFFGAFLRSSPRRKPPPRVPNRRPRFPTSTPPPGPSAHPSGFSIRSQQDSTGFNPRLSWLSFVPPSPRSSIPESSHIVAQNRVRRLSENFIRENSCVAKATFVTGGAMLTNRAFVHKSLVPPCHTTRQIRRACQYVMANKDLFCQSICLRIISWGCACLPIRHRRVSDLYIAAVNAAQPLGHSLCEIDGPVLPAGASEGNPRLYEKEKTETFISPSHLPSRTSPGRNGTPPSSAASFPP